MLKLIDVLECAIGESRGMSVLDFFLMSVRCRACMGRG